MQKHKIYTGITVALGLGLATSLYYMIQRFFIDHSFSLSFRDYCQYVFQLLGIAGLAAFASSKFKKSVLLRIYMCREIFLLPLSAIFYTSYFSRKHVPENQTGIVYFGMFLTVVSLAASVIGLIMLTKERRVKLEEISIAGQNIAEFRPVKAGKRFIHYLIDTVMILYVMYNIYNAFRYTAAVSETTYYYKNFLIEYQQILVIIVYLLYYLLMEGIFKTTAGKCATNTIITNSYGQPACVGQLIGRSFCRLIPFNPLSFFAKSGRGWHDTITDTYVVDSVGEEDPDENLLRHKD